eukprot:Transcript_20612.p1 GENE.Transcript_20612~~Transcript_20612.p1  ORF type:complete len:440 (-),score=79.26 Transcript_20612:48-1367(-)
MPPRCTLAATRRVTSTWDHQTLGPAAAATHRSITPCACPRPHRRAASPFARTAHAGRARADQGGGGGRPGRPLRRHRAARRAPRGRGAGVRARPADVARCGGGHGGGRPRTAAQDRRRHACLALLSARSLAAPSPPSSRRAFTPASSVSPRALPPRRRRGCAGVQLVVWDYRPDLAPSDPNPAFAAKLLALPEGTTPPPLLATSYKGGDRCDGVLPDETARRRNQQAWLAWTDQTGAAPRLGGVVLTGWSRFGHLMPLTEPFAAGVPSLLTALALWSQPPPLRAAHAQAPAAAAAAAAAGAAAAEEERGAAALARATQLETITEQAMARWRGAPGGGAALHELCAELDAASRALDTLHEEWRTQTPPATARAAAPRLRARAGEQAARLRATLQDIGGRATPLMGDEVFRADVAEWHAAKVGALCERVDALAREIEAHVS